MVTGCSKPSEVTASVTSPSGTAAIAWRIERSERAKISAANASMSAMPSSAMMRKSRVSACS